VRADERGDMDAQDDSLAGLLATDLDAYFEQLMVTRRGGLSP